MDGKTKEMGMTTELVAGILKRAGLKNREATDPTYNVWPDYETAKRIIFGGRWLKDSKEYDRIIDWIGDYLNV